jgi:hypothetical protein
VLVLVCARGDIASRKRGVAQYCVRHAVRNKNKAGRSICVCGSACVRNSIVCQTQENMFCKQKRCATYYPHFVTVSRFLSLPLTWAVVRVCLATLSASSPTSTAQDSQ